MGTIVVGVGWLGRCVRGARVRGSRGSGARLRVVSVWEVPAAVYGGGFAPGLDASTVAGFGEAAQKIADEAVATVKTLQPSLACEGKAVEGQPAAVLLEEAAGASLVVVGNRGLGGFASPLLGSVSQQVVHHASCPVVVVREPYERDR
jgi:nucleotide-binding universal stress UspA family protein